MFCTIISPSPVRPYPVNLLRHTWLDLGLSWLCDLAQARSLARPVLPNSELPGEPLKTASGYIVPLPNNQFMYTNIVILLPILYQSFIAALYYCKLFGINIYVLCLMSTLSKDLRFAVSEEARIEPRNTPMSACPWYQLALCVFQIINAGGGGCSSESVTV